MRDGVRRRVELCEEERKTGRQEGEQTDGVRRESPFRGGGSRE